MGSRGPKTKPIEEVWRNLLNEATYTEDGCILVTKKAPIGIGYKYARVDGKDWYVHHIADFMARGKAPEGTVRRHSCDRPNCINSEHILRGTHADNVADKVSKMRHPHGVTHPNSKLHPKQVREIRASPLSYARLSEIYGISRGGIHNIKSGRSWGWFK